jgi:hypothetical protein
MPLFPGHLKIGRFYAVQQGLSARLERFDWQRWLDEVKSVLKTGDLIPAFYYPPQIERKKFSVLLIDQLGDTHAYAKHAWAGSLEQEHLQNERSAAKLLSDLKPQSYSYPRIIHSSCFEGSYYNLFQPITDPCQNTPQRWVQVYEDYWHEMRNLTLQHVELQRVSWWRQVNNLNENWLTLAHWLEAKNEMIACCAAHGDFAPWNLCVTRDTLTIFDWENFEPCAPVLLDPLYFVLSISVYLSNHSTCSEILSKLRQIISDETIQRSWSANLTFAFIYLRLHASNLVFIDMLDRCGERFRTSFITS